MTSLRSRFTGFALVALATASWVPSVSAQTPSMPRSLRLVIPFPAGGTADILGRIVGEKLRPAYPDGVIVDNRVGAGGNIGAEAVYRAAPDGATLMVSPPGPIAINQHLYAKLPFDASKWVPVTMLATVPNVLVVGPRVPATDFAGALAYVKAHPGRVSFASQGNGSTSHLTANLFMSLTGTEMVHVPYKGTGPALVDIMGGQVDFFFDNLTSSQVYHQARKVTIVAVADAYRAPTIMSVPTFAELGLSAMNAVTWFVVVAPPGTPPALAASLHDSIAAALALPDVKRRFAEQGAEVRAWGPVQSKAFIAAESDKWLKVIRAADVKME